MYNARVRARAYLCLRGCVPVMQKYPDAKGVIFDQYSQKGILDAIDKCSAYSQLLKLLLTCGFDLGIPDMGE
jgi:hypothetical protein